MKKYWSLLLLIPFFSIVACMDDTSAYLPQEKEDINVENNFDVDTTNTDSILPEGELVPGLHLVKIKVLQPNHPEPIERQFKYYMPVTINPAKPISLIFDFHGSYTFKSGEKPGNPMSSTTESNPLNQVATENNCIICYPAALPIFQADSSGTVNWMDSENHFPFVDAMIKYFTVDNEPKIDPNRIYSTGHSSGAIFSFVLAFERSNIFAAIAPRAGQMTIKNETVMPERAVPVRVFAGEVDENVSHNAVLENMTDWAEKIGGYFVSDMKMDTATYAGYADVTIRYWHGGNADYEIYSLAGVGHNVNLTECLDDLWDFMESHTLNNVTENLFVTSSVKKIEAQCGEPFTFNINFTEDASVTMTSAPLGWNSKLEGKTVTLTAPKEKDFYGDIDRNGAITFTVTKGNKTSTCKVEYSLVEPKLYFEVGDIYYNEDFQPVGVVCWVNKSNIKEAKIINIDIQKGILYSGNANGLGINFHTPDADDGMGNTKKMVEQNNKLTTPLTVTNAAFMWASSYIYKEFGDWYLPANNELIALGGNLTKINAAINSIKGKEITGSLWSSTNEVKTGETTKTIYSYNTSTKKIVSNKARDEGGEYLGFAAQARAMKTVTK